jgi:DNA-binding NarL/FixJ family response regulator
MRQDQYRNTKILLIDDHTLFREGLHRMLDSDSGLHVCGGFATAEAALSAIHAGLAFDVALVDFELSNARVPAITGLELIEQIRRLRPDARFLVVTGGLKTLDLVHAVQQLNAGVFLKAEPTAELLLAIQRTARGDRWVSSGAALQLVAAHDRDGAQNAPRQALSPRETLVLHGVVEGLGNKEIGSRLDISESSVKAVLQRLFEKTGVRSRSQLVRYAIEAQIDLG